MFVWLGIKVTFFSKILAFVFVWHAGLNWSSLGDHWFVLMEALFMNWTKISKLEQINTTLSRGHMLNWFFLPFELFYIYTNWCVQLFLLPFVLETDCEACWELGCFCARSNWPAIQLQLQNFCRLNYSYFALTSIDSLGVAFNLDMKWHTSTKQSMASSSSGIGAKSGELWSNMNNLLVSNSNFELRDNLLCIKWFWPKKKVV